MLTNKENYLLMMRGELPESIPLFSFDYMVGPSILDKDRNPDRSGIDCFGVEYVFEPTAGGAIPTPGKYLFTDIRKWRDIVKIPDLSGIDWEAMAKKDLERFKPDDLVVGSFITGFFQYLINYMGFTEGLCAIIEEPDEVQELLEVTTDFYLEVASKLVDYYKPDMIWMPDDIATARAPFVSLQSFRECFAPSWGRFVKFFAERDIPTQLHCCGECMILVDDFVSLGFRAWDPVQTSNDVAKVQAKHGKNLGIVGGFDFTTLMGNSDSTEEEIREIARNLIDSLARDGGFGMFGGGNPPPPDPDAPPPPPPTPEMQRMLWAMDEMSSYGKEYYKK